MPVAVLLCEGAPQSPDLVVIAQIVRGLCVVKSAGGKDGLSEAVESLQRMGTAAAALGDGDFPRDLDGVLPQTRLQPFKRPQRPQTGWLWPRKEIENYLVDPDLLCRARGWTPQDKDKYERMLNGVLDRLADSTAARMALTATLPRKTRLDTRITPGCDQAKAREALLKRGRDHNIGASFDLGRLERRYDELRGRCAPGGDLRAAARYVFAGKDMLSLLSQTSGFSQLVGGIPDGEKLAAALATALAEAMSEDPAPHLWTPEWTELRESVQTWRFQPHDDGAQPA
jgi:hypothetical protein